MGLLDDAIREHLQLRRRHGADPGLVAREERDVFGPGDEPAYDEAHVSDGDADALGTDGLGIDDDPALGAESRDPHEQQQPHERQQPHDRQQPYEQGQQHEEQQPHDRQRHEEQQRHEPDEPSGEIAEAAPAHFAEGRADAFSHVGQETAELDMSSVLEAQEQSGLLTAPPVAAGRPVDSGWNSAPQDPQAGEGTFEDESAGAEPSPGQDQLWLD